LILAAARATLAAVVLLAGSTPPPGTGAVCVCATARSTNAWCPVHDVGYVGGLKLNSSWLHEALDAHGHDVVLSSFNCPACRRAIDGDGYCDEHKVGFVHGRAYFSKLTWRLGKAEVREPADIACAICRKNSETHGWCDRDRIGMVGPFAIRDRAAYDEEVHALGIVALADHEAKRCPYCAVAMVTDTQCPLCRITYKDGKRIGG